MADDTLKAQVPQTPSLPKFANWCQPADRRDRVWIVRFEDQERGDCAFTDWEEAKEFYVRATVSWTCWLFEAVAVEALYGIKEPSARDAMAAIGRLPTPMSEAVMEGHEQAYRAIEALFPVRPDIRSDGPEPRPQSDGHRYDVLVETPPSEGRFGEDGKWLDALYRAGCDDATVSSPQSGLIVLSFDRGGDLCVGLGFAVSGIMDAIPGCRIARIDFPVT